MPKCHRFGAVHICSIPISYAKGVLWTYGLYTQVSNSVLNMHGTWPRCPIVKVVAVPISIIFTSYGKRGTGTSDLWVVYIRNNDNNAGIIWRFSMYNIRESILVMPWVHDDVIKWKNSPRYWPFLWGIHRSPVNYPHKGQRRELWCFFDLRLNKRLSKQSRGWCFETPSRPRYDITVMAWGWTLYSYQGVAKTKWTSTQNCIFLVNGTLKNLCYIVKIR